MKRIAFLLGLAITLLTSVAYAQTSRHLEYEAAMVLNIARFAKLPDTAFSGADDPYRICVREDLEIVSALTKLSGKTVQDRKVSVYPYSLDAEPSGCHAMLLTDGMAPTRKPGVLYIALEEGVAVGLAPVELVRIGRQTRFNVDLGAADEMDITLSSKLIDLAIRVR